MFIFAETKFMTPKEKADKLVNSMSQFQYFASREIAIKHALITVDEIIESQPSVIFVSENGGETEYMDKKKYWEEVKQEIKKGSH